MTTFTRSVRLPGKLRHGSPAKRGAFLESQEIPALETISFFQVPWLSFGLRNLTCFSKKHRGINKVKINNHQPKMYSPER